jgi:hypothetical protein
MTDPALLRLIPGRALVERDLEVRFPLPPGDRSLVETGQEIEAGNPLLEHVRDARIEDVTGPGGPDHALLVAGARWSGSAAGRRVGIERIEGELLGPVPGARDRWRLVTGDHRDVVASPLAGTVAAVAPGGGLRIRARGLALRGAIAAGSAARGRLELATDPFGELRPGGIDVGRAGSILVVGSRIDAEALTRARAMGVRGIIVASIPGKDMRDFLASERRQRAALHPTVPFAVLMLDGPIRRPIASPVVALLEALAGREVSLVVDPPALVFDAPDLVLPSVPSDWVRVRHGPNAGAEGRILGLAGLRRFAAGVHLEAARVAIDGEPAIDIPLANLERIG